MAVDYATLNGNQRADSPSGWTPKVQRESEGADRADAASQDNTMTWREHVTVDPDVCHGRACITNTRVLVSTIHDNLAAGLSPEEIMRSHASIDRESIRAAVSYAAELARERVVSLSR